MLTRRNALLGAITATAATMAVPVAARSDTLSTSNYRVPLRHLPRRVEVPADFQPGVIYAVNAQHQLYWVDVPGQAIRYVMAIGAEGRALTGAAVIRRKVIQPSWRPTLSMIEAEPEIYARFRDGLPGGHPMNPLGAAALYLYRGNRDTLYRIHGTPQPWTMGRSFSSGCLRLVNEHILDLYARVPLGTPVLVI
ncbi:L,D-transpeptidase [Histidinibacterium lentulum]|uniref:L,D-transpeptidase n=1 Tax=Histidinibacterium lentulum TaxID=2480588 RepID=A0A3N2R607_9RHOB|nr:L,D-transpeptidase [Histidinibacterium lentulum]ROU02864.1 L,D-transpeptidase [Histidinibacterium lentulum]